MIRRQVVHLCAGQIAGDSASPRGIRVRREGWIPVEVVDARARPGGDGSPMDAALRVASARAVVRVQGDRAWLAQDPPTCSTTRGEVHAAACAGRCGSRWRRRAIRRSFACATRGCGIAPAQIARIFQPFVQATARRGSLGRARHLAWRWPGACSSFTVGMIHASSPSVGQGAEPVVSLPLDHAYARNCEAGVAPGRRRRGARRVRHLPPAAAPARARKRAGWSTATIFEIRGTLQVFLQLEGHTVETDRLRRAALDRIRETNPDVVLLDIDLPVDLDGFAVAEQATRAPRRRCAPPDRDDRRGRPARQGARCAPGSMPTLSKPVDGRSRCCVRSPARDSANQ